MKLALSVAAVVVLLAAVSNADEAIHCPEPGTVVTYSDANSLTFTSQAGLACRARTNKGGLVSQFLGLGFAESDLEKYHVERLLPLRVGSQIDFMTTGTTANATGDLVNTTKDVYYDNTITVARQEKLATTAGTVDTFVIEWHRQVRGRWLGAWLATSWFAPDLSATVKYKLETKQGYGNDISYEIASLALPRGTPATVARGGPAQESGPLPAPRESIKLEQGGGTFLVAAQVNGKMTLNFVLDSGASDVAIPADVVQTLTRAGTVSSADFIGTKTYVLADGSKLPSEAFILHEMRVGNHVVKNVTASVSPVQGKLLLGQSFLSKLPAWTIDNKQHALIIGDPTGSVGAEQVAVTPASTVVAPPKAAPAPAPPTTSAPAPPVALPIATNISSSPAPAAPASPSSSPTPPAVVATASAPTMATIAAGEARFRCPRLGTFIQYSNGTTLKFSGENGFRCAFQDQNYREAEKFAAFADDAKFLDAGLDRLWPLIAGKQQTVLISVSGAYLTQRFTVLRIERVATPAGSFDTVVVEQEETGSGAQWAKRLFWYVPETGLIVKSTFTLLKTADTAIRGGTAAASLVSGDYQAVRIEGAAGKAP